MIKFDRELLFERVIFEELFERKEITAVFRPGNRIFPYNPKGFQKNEILTIKILKKPGDDERIISPIFREFDKKIKIVDIVVTNINQLTSDDFKNCAPIIRTIADLKQYLGLIYNFSWDEVDNMTISKITFEYV